MTDDIKDDGLSAPKRATLFPGADPTPDREPKKPFRLPKAVTWAAAGVGGLFVLLILIGFAVPMFVDFNALRAKTLDEVQKSTGFQVSVGPKIDLIFMPFPKATLHDLMVRHPSDTPDAPLLSAKKVTVDIGLAAILTGKISIPKVAFDQAVINLRQDKNGNNWTPKAAAAQPGDLLKKDGETVATPITQNGGLAANGTTAADKIVPAAAEKAPSFSLDKIVLTDSRINYASAGGKPVDLSVDDASVGLSGFDGPYDVSVKGKAYQNRLPVDLKAHVDEMNKDGKPVNVTVSFKTDAGHVDLDGQATMGDAPQYAGKVDIDFADLSKLLLTMDPKAAAPPVKNVALKGDVVASAKAVKIQKGQVVLDQARGPLELDLNGLGGDTLSGTINTKLDVSKLAMAKGFKELALQGQFSKSGATTKLSPLNVTLDGQTVAGSVAMTGNAIAVNLTSPRLDLTPIMTAFNVKNVPDLVLNGLAVNAAMNGQQLTVTSLSVTDVKGMKLSASGAVADLGKGVGAKLNATLASQNLLTSLKQIPNVTIPKEAEQFLNGPGSAKASYSGTFDGGNLVADLVAMGGTLGVRTTLTDLKTAPKPGALTFVMTHPNTNALLGILAPGTKMGPAFSGPMSVEAGVAQAGDTWNVSNLKAKLGGTTLNGSLAIKTGAVATVSGALQTGAIDLKQWFGATETSAAAGEGNSKATTTRASGAKWSSAPIDVSWMNKLGLDLTLSAAQLTSDPWTITKPTMTIKLAGGALDITDVTGGLLSGTMKAEAHIKNNAGALDTKGSLNATDIDLGGLSRALVKTGAITGKGDLDLSVTSAGASASALISALNGSGSVKTRTLVINGLNAQSLVSAFSAVEDKNWTSALMGAAGSFQNGSTAFDDMTLPITIAKGVATWPSTILKNPSIEVATKGTLDFPAWTVNVENDVAVITPERRNERALVITTTGSLDAPQTKTNAEGVQNKLKDRASKLIDKKLPDKYKGIVGNLLGVQPKTTTTETTPATTTTTAPAVTTTPVAETTTPPATDTAAPVKAPSAKQQLINGVLNNMLGQ